MYRGTTPALTMRLEGAENLDEATCYVTFRQNNKTITKTGSDLAVSGDEIAVFLTQEETLKLYAGGAYVQVRWIYSDGTAMATNIVRIPVNPVLYEELIEYISQGGQG